MCSLSYLQVGLLSSCLGVLVCYSWLGFAYCVCSPPISVFIRLEDIVVFRLFGSGDGVGV